jgi:hypothetical protein
MPLNTQIIRNGEALKIRWGGFHIAAMALAASFDSGEGPLQIDKIYEEYKHENYPEEPFPVTRQIVFVLSDYMALAKTPLNEGQYTLIHEHKFVDTTDGEVLILLPGDLLVAVRGC